MTKPNTKPAKAPTKTPEVKKLTAAGARTAKSKSSTGDIPASRTKPKPTAPPAAPKLRHYGLAFSFVLAVILPLLAIMIYLFIIAADQYGSRVGFAVRTEEVSSPVELLGGLTSLSTGGAADTDILYEFIQSEELVRLVDKKLDLRALYNRPGFDPLFTLGADSTIEDLADQWQNMVRISYDGGTGLIELLVLAFDPEEARQIATTIVTESSRLLNELSAIAREDTTRYARIELDKAVVRLKEARRTLTEFRNKTQIVDPSADIQGQMGLLNTLQQQLAETIIEMDLLRRVTRDSDPRLERGAAKIEVIESRIFEERRKFGITGNDGSEEAFAELFGEYETLTVDREFAEQAYLSALASYDTAVAEARRQSRYLAPYINPTTAEKSQHPRRWTLTGLTAMFLVLLWGIGALIFYSLRDRR